MNDATMSKTLRSPQERSDQVSPRIFRKMTGPFNPTGNSPPTQTSGRRTSMIGSFCRLARKAS
jgi:hypothetical protein